MHYNDEANYYLYGGSVDVECSGAWFGFGPAKVWTGDLHPYAYRGSSGPTSSGRTGEQGWAYHNSSTSFDNGSTAGGTGNTTWQQVLDGYLQTGYRTDAWTIVVDNVIVCTAADDV